MRAGNDQSCAWESWPTWDERWFVQDSIEMPIQVNGKVRGRVTVAVDLPAKEIEAQALSELESVLEGQTIRKVIVVPGRMVNIVASS